MKILMKSLVALFLSLPAAGASAWADFQSWNDNQDIVIDDVLLPSSSFSDPAQFQMSEYNAIDSNDNSHAFRVSSAPQFSFGANDGDNTLGFLSEESALSEYGLNYTHPGPGQMRHAIAWALTSISLPSGELTECDAFLDPAIAWRTSPDFNFWFQSTILHELGHCRGLKHFNSFQSMQNSATSKFLRDEVLYMDDKDGIRENSSHLLELDVAIYNKWHDGAKPQWMTMSDTTLREGGLISFNGVTVENTGTNDLNDTLEVAYYLSEDADIATSDTRMGSATWSSFQAATFSTFNITFPVPEVNDCGSYYAGAILDPNNDWSEVLRTNNTIDMINGGPYVGTTYTRTSLNISLAEDIYEPNDSMALAEAVSLPFLARNLTVDQDFEVDYYEIQLSESTSLWLVATFEHARGNLAIQVQNSTGAIVASADSGNDHETLLVTLDPGTYYLRVHGVGAGSCNRYSILVFDNTSSCGLGFEAGLIVPLIGLLRRRLRRRSGSEPTRER